MEKEFIINNLRKLGFHDFWDGYYSQWTKKYNEIELMFYESCGKEKELKICISHINHDAEFIIYDKITKELLILIFELFESMNNPNDDLIENDILIHFKKVKEDVYEMILPEDYDDHYIITIQKINNNYSLYIKEYPYNDNNSFMFIEKLNKNLLNLFCKLIYK